MASLRKTLALRFSQITKSRHSSAAASSPPAAHPSLLHRFPGGGEEARAVCRFAFLQKRPVFQPALPPDRFLLPADEKIAKEIRALSPPRIRLDGLRPPQPTVPAEDPELEERKIAAEEVRKLMRASQMEAVRGRLQAAGKSCVAYPEFLRICCEAAGAEQGPSIARLLDDSSAVVVLGNVVFLRPDEVAKAIENMIPMSLSHPHDPRYKELREMEEKKAEIDQKAATQVRRELWGGLGYLVLQTAAFMRLTFWELSWDVMEPICFYVTSIYFMAGYAFFLRTSKEPSFEGFFQSRFTVKQKRLMKAKRFDLDRFNELRESLEHSSLDHQEFYCNCIGRGH